MEKVKKFIIAKPYFFDHNFLQGYQIIFEKYKYDNDNTKLFLLRVNILFDAHLKIFQNEKEIIIILPSEKTIKITEDYIKSYTKECFSRKNYEFLDLNVYFSETTISLIVENDNVLFHADDYTVPQEKMGRKILRNALVIICII